MGFKLGNAKQNYMTNGVLKNKLTFGSEAGDVDVSVPGTPVIRKNLGPNVLGEANMDGTIYISNKIQPGSNLEQEAIREEMIHATEIKLGKLAYNDDAVYYNGVTYPRETINGKDMIKVDGQWKEAGAHDFPWEKKAKI
tara:strand:- start:48 stop:464 length:417 start_codon:yes stop_codon:yes gene_type:complete